MGHLFCDSQGHSANEYCLECPRALSYTLYCCNTCYSVYSLAFILHSIILAYGYSQDQTASVDSLPTTSRKGNTRKNFRTQIFLSSSTVACRLRPRKWLRASKRHAGCMKELNSILWTATIDFRILLILEILLARFNIAWVSSDHPDTVG
jgi:hypothetical protein